MEWREIETAPKDGSSIMTVRIGYEPSIVEWFVWHGKGKWVIDPETFMEDDHFEAYWDGSAYEPTHWMPLPEPPKWTEENK